MGTHSRGVSRAQGEGGYQGAQDVGQDGGLCMGRRQVQVQQVQRPCGQRLAQGGRRLGSRKARGWGLSLNLVTVVTVLGHKGTIASLMTGLVTVTRP